MRKPISILMGSASDLETVRETTAVLKDFKAGFEIKVLSAHRSPKELARYVETAVAKGTKVFIAAAGGSAALAGVIASHTVLSLGNVSFQRAPLSASIRVIFR